LAAVLLVGCGSGAHVPAVISKPHPSVKKLPKPDDGSRNLVSAVTANKTGNLPLQVKFALKARPDVGQALDVDLVVVPLSASVDRIAGKIEGSDGLQIQDGAQLTPVDRPVEGTPLHHTIRVLPQRDGIFTFNAVLTVDSGGQSLSESYAMPLIAGAGLPDLPAKPTAATPTTTAAAH
jgi:hypothetical protein